MIIDPINLMPYFPDTCVEDLELKIQQAQSIIESHLVANRSLEIKKYSELREITAKSGNVGLVYLPLLDDDINYPKEVFIRQTGYNWLQLETTQYSFDSDLSELAISDIWFGNYNQGNYNYYGRGYNNNLGNKYYQRTSKRDKRLELKINYYSGFDLDNIVSGDNEAENFKTALINLIKVQTSDSNAGLKRFNLYEHYEVEYQSSKDRASVSGIDPLNDLLAYFKKFKGRTFTH